jgi:hypothetical protein
VITETPKGAHVPVGNYRKINDEKMNNKNSSVYG